MFSCSQPLDYLKPKTKSGEVIPNSKENASLLNTLIRRRRRQGMKIRAKKKEVVVLSLIKLLLFWYEHHSMVKIKGEITFYHSKL